MLARLLVARPVKGFNVVTCGLATQVSITYTITVDVSGELSGDALLDAVAEIVCGSHSQLPFTAPITAPTHSSDSQLPFTAPIRR